MAVTNKLMRCANGRLQPHRIGNMRSMSQKLYGCHPRGQGEVQQMVPNPQLAASEPATPGLHTLKMLWPKQKIESTHIKINASKEL